MTRTSERAAMLVASAVAAAAIAAGLVARSSPASSGPDRAAAASRVAERQAFAVLRPVRGRVALAAARALPSGVLAGLSRDPGLSPSEAVFAGGAYPTWIVPGAGRVCLVIAGIGRNGVPAASCGSPSEAEAGQITLLTETDSGTPLAFGLAASNNAGVTVTDANGSTKALPLTNNVYEVTSGTPASVSLKTASGSAVTDDIALPPKPADTRPAESATP